MIFLLLLGFVLSKEYTCIAPECKSTEDIISNSKYNFIHYVITEIVSNTNLHCYGYGQKILSNGCGDETFEFQDLGIMKEGDTWPVFWSDNAGTPAIKCNSSFKWTWKISFASSGNCKGDCCGSVCMDDKTHICCDWPIRHVCERINQPWEYEESCCGDSCCAKGKMCCRFNSSYSNTCYDPTIESC